MRSSSRTRSLMSTFESTAMPSVSAIAAMPGSVSVAWRSERIAISIMTLQMSEIALTMPKTW